MTLPWNLVAYLTIPGSPRRAFYLPLASIPPGSTSVRSVPLNTFTPSDQTTVSDDKVFNIRISPPSGGFTDEVTVGGTLPDPAFRLHAMDAGDVRYEPEDSTTGSLILEMNRFSWPIGVLWWGRWLDAGCIPYQLIYENVDRTELAARLNLLKPGESFHGLALPPEVVDSGRAQFITDFLAGSNQTCLIAEAGAVIGTAAADPDHNGDRLLKLRGRYKNHTDVKPQFMNPREFFYLLFGKDSDEANNHPLLLKMDEVGKATTTGLETRSVRLRPPLRTHGRVIWESNIEIQKHKLAWSRTASCKDRFYNTLDRDGRTFNRATYKNTTEHDGFKCNLFVCDIALRSGFRVCIHDAASASKWHYIAASKYADRVNGAKNNSDRVALKGWIAGTWQTWGFKIESMLRSGTHRKDAINELMEEEGRCLILAGSRKNSIGHIMILEEVKAEPEFKAIAGQGLESIEVTIHEALGAGGASSSDDTCKVGATGGAADFHKNFERLHLFELHPGKDPDTKAGLSDCNLEI